ncbi:hypothetical protein MUK70_15255 [Dyadobacter chenwenxiniae]|uniref:Tetratricopeptide repeat protein n=1 Tax=Dyadobacter chenwenxiniae TaxID=2906456 RepID=A0A9X1PGA1_9BACT|nr:hypothetical protein [Dyadobacter chenwenxiniae]MCF0060600.1 hypothetical protein [Dyadobacter chenwenxiniae]UON86331.1 hypothetical protein MUK70_15255 [Dyadobacter chenwenxiniae]
MKRPVGQLEEWEWIEKYWSGKLSHDEKLFFEKEMKENEDFAREAKSLRPGIQLLEEVRFEKNARHILEKLRDEGRSRRKVTRIFTLTSSFAAAACIAFILFLAYSPLRLPAQENDLSILRDFRAKYKADSTNNLSLAKKQAFDLFFEGQSYLAEGESQLAQQRFEKVLGYSDLRPYFKEAAQWHLVICYLKNSQTEKANETYHELQDSKEYSVPAIERWKIWWHLKRSQWTGGS